MRRIKCTSCGESYESPAKAEDVPKDWICLNCIENEIFQIMFETDDGWEGNEWPARIDFLRGKIQAEEGEFGPDAPNWAKTFNIWHRYNKNVEVIR